MQDNNITEVDFKEVAAEAPAKFSPVEYLTKALALAGHAQPTAWMLHIDERAETAEEENDRIFFANRALRLYMSEQTVPDTISPRMVIAEGIGAERWSALIDQAIVPWLMGKFDSKGRRIKETVEAVAPVADPGFPDNPTLPEAPVLKEFEGELNLSEDEKSVLRDFFAGDEAEITINERTYLKIHRNGANCQEWFFVSEPNVHYPLPLGATLKNVESFESSTEPTDLAAKINAMAPASRTVNFNMGADEEAPGSMDSLPGSITE